MSDELSNFDIAAIVLSLLLFAGYHINLYVFNPLCFGGRMPFSVNLKNASMFLRKHKEMSESPAVLLAIQTFRNTMMAGVFVGGNALGWAYTFANEYQYITERRYQIRSIIIMILMFASFLCWANVVRLCSVLGYLVGTMQYSEKLRKEAIEQEKLEYEALEAAQLEIDNEAALNSSSTGTSIRPITPPLPKKRTNFFRSKFEELDFERHGHDKIEQHRLVSSEIPNIYEEGDKMIRMMAIYFSFGFRLIFISISFAFYTAGATALIISSFCLWMFLLSYDYVRHSVNPRLHHNPTHIALNHPNSSV